MKNLQFKNDYKTVYYKRNVFPLMGDPVIEIKLNDNKKPRNKKLDRQRGLSWEDELTREINQGNNTSDAYNLGGSTSHIPDIVVVSNYKMKREDKETRQLKFIQKIADNEKIELSDELEDKFFFDNPYIVIECKFTTKDVIKVPKEDLDKCFDFVRRLIRYDTFVVLACKFQISKKKSKKIFIIMKSDKQLFLISNYTYLRVQPNGDYIFMRSQGVGKNSEPDNSLNLDYFRRNNIKVVHDKFVIADI